MSMFSTRTNVMIAGSLCAAILVFSGRLRKILTTCHKVKINAFLNTQDITLPDICHNQKCWII